MAIKLYLDLVFSERYLSQDFRKEPLQGRQKIVEVFLFLFLDTRSKLIKLPKTAYFL